MSLRELSGWRNALYYDKDLGCTGIYICQEVNGALNVFAFHSM